MSQPESDPSNIPEAKQSTTSSDSTRVPPLCSDYAPYPKLDPKHVAPPPENWTNVSMGSQSQPNQGPATFSGSAATTMPAESNPYVSPAPVRSSSVKNKMGAVKEVLGKLGKKAAEDTKKAKEIAGNMWQHLLVFELVLFRTTFETAPEEQLLKTYACYLSTSAGKAIEMSCKISDFSEVAIPLHQLRAVNPSTSKANSAEKYIQIISVDNHEFWFMGFVRYDSAVKNLQRPLQPARSS
ncbi:hypothetical protein GOBAR_AA35061 [Gossypium barbadense]|uniref:GRAM domain-containing protein n=1 Tax=Gossypium barbadense TaxID=3634 RepID=A0A2P5W3D2_GOSBA|nr:hypothetical protein GOBAR_AA35061 [Gossypium barbadense]